LGATQTSPASLSINLAQGRIYQQAALDAASYGLLPSDSTLVMQQGFAAAQAVTLTTAALSAGQSQWALVQAMFSPNDQVRANDPTGGVLFYWNSANPSQPLQGPSNTGATQPTERASVCTISVIYGSPATTGSEVPPQPTVGFVPLYLVDLTFGQSAITTGQIVTAGPSVGTGVPSNYPYAPFLAGLLNQHHKGTAGQAPQIDLTAEVKNLLPLANLPASNTAGGISAIRRGSGNPNGNLAGNTNTNGAPDFYYDDVNLILYVCSVTGTSSTAVWTAVGSTASSIFAGGTATGTVNAQVVASTTPAGFTKTPGQVVTFTGLNNTGSATLNIDGTGASAVNKNTGSGNVPLTGGEMNGFVSVIWTGTVYLISSQILGQLATLNIGAWLKNDGAGNLTIKNGALLGDDGSGNFNILNSGVTAATYTRPKMTVGASGQVTTATNGAFPTYTQLNTGTGLYTTPAGAKRLKIRMRGGGGAGASGTSNGGNGGISNFGSTGVFGGGGATSSGTPGTGGTGGSTGTGIEIARRSGANGSPSSILINQASGAGTTFQLPGGNGGGAGGGVGAINAGGGNATSWGCGSAGQGRNVPGTAGSYIAGPGGGECEDVEFVINNPASTYNYTVGVAGSAPSGAGSPFAGVILIEEFYD
jgi:hypothetical protein